MLIPRAKLFEDGPVRSLGGKGQNFPEYLLSYMREITVLLPTKKGSDCTAVWIVGFLVVVLVFETGSHIAQTSLELVMELTVTLNLGFSCLYLLSAGM